MRADFFGDELEKLRVLDGVGTDLKVGEKIEKALILPAKDFYIDPLERATLKLKLQAEIIIKSVGWY